MGAPIVTSLSSGPERWPVRAGARGDGLVYATPTWSLRVEGKKLAIVLARAPLPGGAELAELVVELPHVSFPFDFRDGLERFRHQRGVAEELTLRVEARVLLDWLNQASGGAINGTAQDDQLVLSGRSDGVAGAAGPRWTMRARLVPDPRADGLGAAGEALAEGGEAEPLLQLSLYGIRVYGVTTEPWPLMAERVLRLLPSDLVVDRTLTTARIRCVRLALAWALSALGWKLPDVARLEPRGVELREGRFYARFAVAGREREREREAREMVVDADGTWGEGLAVRTAFERFVEDLELKRHHGQVDRLLAEGKVREALAEVYRALEGPPRPGFLAERLIGIAATQPILYDEGERICRALLEVAPGYEPALVGLASIALGRQRPEEAAVQLERLSAVLTAPGDREDATAADLTLAQILREFAPDESRAALERVLLRSPDHEEALAELIALAEQEGDVRHALPLYKRLLFAARSKARTREAGLRLARFALARNDPEDARVLLKVVLEAAPDDLEAQVALAEVETREGRGLEALRILDEALRQLPPSDSARLVKVIALLGRLLLDVLADPARARRVLWRAGDLSRMEPGYAIELAGLALKAREATLALRFCELVPTDAAEWAESQALRAEALIARGDPRQALQALLGVLSREPDHERALSLLEVAAPEAGQREWLVHQLYESARKVPGGEPRANILHRVARLYESLGLAWDALHPLEEAVIEAPAADAFEARAERLMELQRDFGLWPEYLRTGASRLVKMRAQGLVDEAAIGKRVGLLTALGRVALDELGEAREARASLEEAARLSPRSVEAQELLARALEAELRDMSGHAELRDVSGEASRAVVHALVGVLTRLQSLRPEGLPQDEVRLRLAELQLDKMNALGPARATLGKLGPGAHTERARRLMERVGLIEARPVAVAPPASPAPPALVTPAPTAPSALMTPAPTAPPALMTPAPTAPPVLVTPAPAAPPASMTPAAPPPRPAGRDLWDEAVARADRGDDDGARTLLEALLADDPGHVPARELLALLAPAAPPRVEPAPPAWPAAEPVAAAWGSAPEPVAAPAWPSPVPDAAPAWPAPEVVAPPAPEPARPIAASPTPVAAPAPDDDLPSDWEPWPEPPVVLAPRAPAPAAPAPAAVPPVPVAAAAVAPAPVAPDPDAERPAAPISEAAGAQIAAKAAEGDAIDALLGEATQRFFGDDLDGARESLDRLLALDPDVVPALELYQEICAAQGDHAQRAEILALLVERVFDGAASAAYLKALGEARAAAGDHDAALAAYQRYLRLRPLDEAVFSAAVAQLGADEGAEAAGKLAEIWEARADALEDAEASPGLIARALLMAAKAHFRGEEYPAAAYAAERADRLASPGQEDPEVLDLLVRAELAAGGKAAMERARAAAARLLPLLLPGPERDWIASLAGAA